MKVRSGFVSNSSSTSFLVEVPRKSDDVCPHCGRKENGSEHIIDLIKHECGKGGYCDDSEFKWENPEEFIEELEQEIESEKLEIDKWKSKKANDLAGYENRFKVSDLRRWAKDQIVENTRLIGNIRKALGRDSKVVSFAVSYHDEPLNSMVKLLISNKDIVVINSEE